MTTDALPTRRSLRAAHHARRRKTGWFSATIGVIGELLITAGVVVLLFIAWKLWIYDARVDAGLQQQADQLTDQWGDGADAAQTPGDAAPQPGTPVALSPRPAERTYLGVVYAQRLGDSWKRPIAAGTDRATVLDKLGAGWYTDTQLPGQIGNFAIASHRGGNGASFHYLPTLRIGDKVTVETKDGWYVYDYRNTEYVMDTAVDVLNPVPQTTATATEQLFTMTTCNPYPFTNGERVIVYSTFEAFYPRDGGRPAVLDYLEG